MDVFGGTGEVVERVLLPTPAASLRKRAPGAAQSPNLAFYSSHDSLASFSASLFTKSSSSLLTRFRASFSLSIELVHRDSLAHPSALPHLSWSRGSGCWFRCALIQLEFASLKLG